LLLSRGISEYGKSRLLIENLFCETASKLNVKFTKSADFNKQYLERLIFKFLS
jgi:hypothetical protein